MPKKTSTKRTDLKKLATSLREFANSCPSALEREELQRTISEIIAFLSEIRTAVAAMPSQENAAAMESALRALERFADHANTNPSLSAVLGIPRPRPTKPKPVVFTMEETALGQRLLDEMRMLPIDEMRSRLLDETTLPLRSLQALASQLGIRSSQRTSRDVLTHQIASKISNYRGYQGLRAGTESA